MVHAGYQHSPTVFHALLPELVRLVSILRKEQESEEEHPSRADNGNGDSLLQKLTPKPLAEVISGRETSLNQPLLEHS